MIWLQCLAIALLVPYTTALYSRKGDVQQLTAKTLKSTLKTSDLVTVLEFYAPWCGHCKNLAPIYAKTASSLKGLVNVAAIDCDEESNKRICGEYGVQGFPTIKMARPKLNAQGERSFSIEDYNGARTVKAIADHATSIMPSNVEKLTSDKIDSFLNEKNTTAKVLLFTKKGTTSPIYKALSTSFKKDSVIFGQVRDTQTAAVSMFGIESFPTLVILPGGTEPIIKYGDDMKIEPMRQFVANYVVVETNDSQSEAREPIAQEAPASSPAQPTSEPKVCASVADFDTLFTEGKAASVLLRLSTLGSSSSSLANRITPLPLVDVSEEVRDHLESELKLPLQDYIYLNAKKQWYITPKHTLDSDAAVLEFLDEVRQGSAGKKTQLKLGLKQKDEL